MFGMESVKEQRICVKFCFKVGKPAAEATTCCVKLTAMMPQITQLTYDSKVLKMEELQWMKMSSLANLQLQDPNS
jgi:hypothetical protein